MPNSGQPVALGAATTYQYNDAELPASAAAALTQTFAYDQAGRMTSETLSGQTLTAGYNADGTLANQHLTVARPHQLGAVDWAYQYDGDGRLASQQLDRAPGTENQTLCYGYDTASRLSAANQVASSQPCPQAPAPNITWDHNSNRLSSTAQLASAGPAQPTLAFTYRADNSIASETNNGTSHADTATPFGAVSSDGAWCYAYDGFDRVSSVSLANGAGCSARPTTTYAYDALDRQRTVATTTAGTQSAQTFHYDGWSPTVGSVTGSGGAPITYELSSADRPLAVTQGTTSQTLVTDGQGSITTAVNSDGSLGCAARFDPFGSALNPGPSATAGQLNPCNAGSTPNTYFYRAARVDATTGDYSMGSRLYDPKKDSFLMPDTYRSGQPASNPSVGTDPLTLNTYTYVNGDPVNLSDPSGHMYTCGMNCPVGGARHQVASQQQRYVYYEKHPGDAQRDQQAIDAYGYQQWAAQQMQQARQCSANPLQWSNCINGFAADHWHEMVSLSAGIIAGGLCEFFTAGGGTMLCAAVGGAVAGAIQGGLDCQKGQALAGCIGVGALTGGVTGAAAFGLGSLLRPFLSKAVGSLTGVLGRGATDATATASRGLSNLGGVFTDDANAAGGRVWTSVGDISQNDVAPLVNSGMYGGNVNVISGVHGLVDGSTIADSSMYADDVLKFGSLPGVNVYNLPAMTSEEVTALLNGPGTTIGAFCNSGACLAGFR